jgi:hypothetical protein
MYFFDEQQWEPGWADVMFVPSGEQGMGLHVIPLHVLPNGHVQSWEHSPHVSPLLFSQIPFPHGFGQSCGHVAVVSPFAFSHFPLPQGLGQSAKQV